jgi:hypothetical protein
VTAEAAGWRLDAAYADPLGGYVVRHPADWAAQPQDEPGLVVLAPDVLDPNVFFLILAKPLTFLSAELGADELETADVLSAALAPVYGVDPQALEPGVVGDVPAFFGPWQQTAGSEEMTGRIFFFTSEGLGFVIAFATTPEQAASLEPVGRAMLDSFTLVQPALIAEYENGAEGISVRYPEGWTVEGTEAFATIGPLADLEPNEGPYVALFAGSDSIAGAFGIDGELDTASIIDAFVTSADVRAGGQAPVEIGGEQAIQLHVALTVDELLVEGELLVWDPAVRPLVVVGLAPASQWPSFAPTFAEMMDSLALSEEASG